MSLEEIRLIESAKENISDFNSLVDQYYPKALKWCYRLTNNEEDIKDIIQEAFIKVYRDLPKLQESSKFNPWFRKVVVNTAYDWFRKHSKEYDRVYIENEMDLANEYEKSVEDIVVNNQLGNYIKSSIENLSENNRIVFNLFYGNGLKCSDIADMLNLSETAVKNRLSRTRKYLRDELMPYVDSTYLEREKSFRILVICGSHRAGGDSFKVALRVKEAVSKKSPKSVVDIIELANFEIGGCKVCNNCRKTGQCSIGDHFNQVYEQILNVDAIVFVTPYYAPIPSKLAAMMERLLSISISPFTSGESPGRAFPLQKKWAAVLNFSQVKQQGYLASVIREPLVSMGLGLIITEDRLSPEASIFDHGDVLGKLLVERLVTSPDSNAIDNWFDYWNEENLRILDLMHHHELKTKKGSVWEGI